MKQQTKFNIKIPWTYKYSNMLFISFIILVVASGYTVSLQDITSYKNHVNNKRSVENLPTAVIQKDSISDDEYEKLSSNCPSLDRKIYQGYSPTGFLTLGPTYIGSKFATVKVPDSKANSLDQCINECCNSNSSCESIFAFSKSSTLNCYMVTCQEGKYCLPTKSAEKLGSSTAVVLLRPPSGFDSWEKVFESARNEYTPVSCEVGLDRETCTENEECVPPNSRSRNGICKCKSNFVRNTEHICIYSAATEASTLGPAKITVQVHSKNITLPLNTATLTAYSIPDAPEDYPYSYEWSLIDDENKDDGKEAGRSGVMESKSEQQLKLSKLEEGTYTFKVTVVGSKSEKIVSKGEAVGIVTVFPALKVNQPPQAIVNPPTQVVTLPTKKAIIDGSSSTDDEDISQLTYKWEIRKNPIKYEIPTQHSTDPTLTLDNLVAGNYTIRLTVTDANGGSNFADAFLEVEEEQDYPPTANAGEDIILHLPKNEVTLHGNGSSDDHGIVSYEWTRTGGSDKDQLPADITDTRTPHPKLSNLEEGTYTFKLKVTDIKEQISEDTVTIYVQPPRNQPPTANAGSDSEISLPQNFFVLDGTQSSDDQGIIKYTWSQVSGPNDALILPVKNESFPRWNATGLTKGDYVFSLTVEDGADNKDSAQMTLVVKQDENQAPVANAGGMKTVHLPKSVFILDGSKSSDDLKIAKWKWSRLSSSLAAGKIVGDSASNPSLLLVDLVPGDYQFQLEVWDDQGKSSKDSATLTVQENPEKLNVVEAVLNEKMSTLTQSRLDSLTQKIGLLLRSSAKAEIDESVESPIHVKVFEIFPQRHTGYAIIYFTVEETQEKEKIKTMSGIKVVDDLNSKIKQGQDILDLKLLELDTLVCQNDCSGHGKCQESTRECICEPFWIENSVRRHLMDGKKNCDWSVIYVGIILSVMSCFIICGAAYVLCKNKKRSIMKLALHKTRDGNSRSSRSKRRYTKLDQFDTSMELRNAHTSSLMKSSESDSESDELMLEEYRGPRPRKNGASRTGRSSKIGGLGLLAGSGGSSADGSSGNGSAITPSSPQANIAIRRGNGYAKFNHEDKA